MRAQPVSRVALAALPQTGGRPKEEKVEKAAERRVCVRRTAWREIVNRCRMRKERE